MIDHLLLGGEQAIKVSPGFNSPVCRNYNDLSAEEKKEVVNVFCKVNQISNNLIGNVLHMSQLVSKS